MALQKSSTDYVKKGRSLLNPNAGGWVSMIRRQKILKIQLHPNLMLALFLHNY